MLFINGNVPLKKKKKEENIAFFDSSEWSEIHCALLWLGKTTNRIGCLAVF